MAVVQILRSSDSKSLKRSPVVVAARVEEHGPGVGGVGSVGGDHPEGAPDPRHVSFIESARTTWVNDFPRVGDTDQLIWPCRSAHCLIEVPYSYIHIFGPSDDHH